MLRDHYEPEDIFKRVPELALKLDPILAQLDSLLDDDELFNILKADLKTRYPQTPSRGRPSTPVEVILRMLILKHLQDWSYEELEQFVADSLVLRQFCRVYLNPVPDDTTLIRWANTIQPETLHQLHERAVQLARSVKVTRARKLRVDSTVVETDIHPPSDSSLLADGVRVLSRLIKAAQAIVGKDRTTTETETKHKRLFRDRTRSAKQWARRIGRWSRSKGRSKAVAQRFAQGYRHLLGITQASVRQARQVKERLTETEMGKMQEEDMAGEASHIRKLVEEVERFVPRVEQVIEQTQRRIVSGEAVPAAEKVVSLFEPHTEIIRRGKPKQPTEFGRKVRLEEVEGGIVSGYRIEVGNPGDEAGIPEALDAHMERFGRVPWAVTADRGCWSPENEQYAEQLKVKRIALPKKGRKSQARAKREQAGWFKRLQRFRVGIEGRISVLKRKHGLRRCRNRGEEGFERWVGWGIIAGNLEVMARTLAARG